MTYTNIPSTSKDAGSPITAELINALDENLDAAFAGDAGAPKLQARVYDTLSSGGDTGTRRYYDNNEYSKGGTSYNKVFEIAFVQSGGIRVQVEQKAAGGSGSLQIRLNGVTVSEWTTSSTSWQERAVTISFDANDRISVHIQGEGVGETGYARRFALRTDGECIHFVPVEAQYGTTPSS